MEKELLSWPLTFTLDCDCVDDNAVELALELELVDGKGILTSDSG